MQLKPCYFVADWSPAPLQQLLPGARHAAAFLFAYVNPGALALVVSEDGPVHCALKIDHRVVVWPVYVPET